MEDEIPKTNDIQTKISKRDVAKAFWRWMFFSHANYNYERLQATGFIYALSPILKKLYGQEPEKLKESLERHLQFFNTEPTFGDPILSITIAMEEQKSNGLPIKSGMIEGFKTGMMGPLAGIGDTLFQGILIPILLSLTISFGAKGNILLGPIAFAVLLLGITLPIAYVLWMKGYETGREGIIKMLASSMMQKVMTFSQTLGSIVIGALAAKFVIVQTPLKIALGKNFLKVQEGILDKLILGFLPLVVTLCTYLLLKKKFKPTTVLGIMIVVSGILATCGILGV